MAVAGLPDLLIAGRNARTIADVQARFDRVSEELTSGRQADVVKASGGDPIRLYAVERDLALVRGQENSISTAIGRAGLMQTALERIQNTTSQIGVSLAAAVEIRDIRASELKAQDARGGFADVVTTLNVRFGDRSLFAGAAVDGSALAPADDILAEIAARVAGAADAAAAIAAVDDYFYTDPAGFAATGYVGSTVDVASTELEPGLRLDFALRADDRTVVDSLRTLALAVVGYDGAFAGATQGERLAVLGEASRSGLNAVEGVVLARGVLGGAEARLEETQTRLASEVVFLERAKNAIIARDQFEAATEFNALETQISLIFEMTARMSGLTLANFLR